MTTENALLVQAANELLDDVRQSVNPLTMLIYGQVIKTFLSPVLIMIAASLLVVAAREFVDVADNALVSATVNFVGLVIGFLAAHAVWRLMERRYHGVALLKLYLTVASDMSTVKKLVKQSSRGEFVPQREFDDRSGALTASCEIYLSALEDAGLLEWSE